MNKLVLMLVLALLALGAWWFWYRAPATDPSLLPDSFDSAYRDLLTEVAKEKNRLDLPNSIARFDDRIDSYNLSEQDKIALHDLTAVYAGFTGFVAFSTAQEQIGASIGDLTFGQYCEFKQLFLEEAQNEKKAIDALDEFKQKLANFKQNYPDKARELKLDQLSAPSTSTTEWRSVNEQKTQLFERFAQTCGVAS